MVVFFTLKMHGTRRMITKKRGLKSSVESVQLVDYLQSIYY